MKVTKSLHTSTECTRDQWETALPTGIEMFGGYYYNQLSTQMYRLLKKCDSACGILGIHLRRG